MVDSQTAEKSKKPLVLVVDDEPDFQHIVLDMLVDAGFEVKAASSVNGALSEIKRNSFDLVITDIWMPQGSGVDLVEKLAKTRPTMEVVAMSAFASEATRKKVLDLGCYELIEKHALDKLLSTVKEAAGKDRRARLGTGQTDHEKRDRLLVVEDEPNFREMVKDALEQAGYEVVVAANGREGVEAFDAGQFDAVITDINMPVMNGVEFVKQIRERDRDVGILVVSGEATARELHEALTHGADSMLCKPVDLDALQRKAQEYVSLTQERKRRRLRHERRGDLTTTQKVGKWFISRRYARRRKKIATAFATLLLAIGVGAVSVTICDWIFNAGRWSMDIVERFDRRAANIEGYLKRDEQRELDQQRRERRN